VIIKFFLFLILSCALLFAQESQEKKLSLFDEKDDMFDLSEYLSTANGFLPIPAIITEPAVGYGAGVGLVYLHDNFTGKKTKSGRIVPASMSGVVGMGTQNGTKFGGAFHIGYWLDDQIRTITFAGLMDINIDVYRLNGKALSSNLKGGIGYQAFKFRMFDTNLFLGTAYLYNSVDSILKDSVDIKANHKTASVEFLMEYDARNNTLSPTSGYFLNLRSSFFSKSVGGDYDFQRYMANGFFYLPLNDKVNLNVKLNAESITGKDTPFYLYPFVYLRGMPVMKVQGEHIAVSEAELSWNFTKRWDALIFGGIGKAFGTNQFKKGDVAFNNAQNHFTKGIGFRYLLARKYGLKMGIDIASSQYDDALYIQFGTAWKGF